MRSRQAAGAPVTIFCATLLALTSALPPTPAFAVAIGDPALPCTSEFGAVAAKDPYVATVAASAGGRLHFIRGKDPKAPICPSLAAACRLPAYLVVGDKVLISAADDVFACVHFAAAPGKVTTGLVSTKDLSFRSDGGDDRLDGPGGLGDWSAGDRASITIKPGGNGYVLLDGGATRGPPSYNTGEIAGPAFLGGEHENIAGYADEHYTGASPAADPPKIETQDACRIRLRRFGPFLLVDDNDSCGGFGVTFSGLYVKR